MIDLRDYTLASVIDHAAVSYPQYTALETWRDSDSVIKYPELLAKVRSFADSLVRAGFRKGGKVAILGESCPNWVVAYFGVNYAGGVVVPILPDFSKHEVEGILEHSEAEAIVVNSKHVVKALACGKPIIRMEDLHAISAEEMAKYDGKNFKDLEGVCATGNVLSDEQLQVLADRRPTEQDLASLIYTSGSTGTPKAVMLTNRNIVYNAEICVDPFIKIIPGWKALSILPLSHVYEFTVGMVLLLLTGIQITYLGKAPSTDSMLPALKEVRPHVVMSVPLLIEKIYRRALLPKLKEGTKLGKLYRNRLTRPLVLAIIGKTVKKLFGGNLLFFGVGGAAFDPEAEEFFHKIKFPYAIGYGLTETSPLIAGCAPTDQVPGTVGPCLKQLEVKIDPENSEILIKGDSVMQGYYKNDALNAEVFTEDGFFRTGDIGEFTKDNRLVLKGRCKTMILGPSGENIFPESIEFVIDAEEDVVESLVVADKGGLTALIRLDMRALKHKGVVAKEAVEEYLAKIKKNVNEKLSSFSKIRKVEFQEEPFERTPSNKIKRFKYQKKD